MDISIDIFMDLSMDIHIHGNPDYNHETHGRFVCDSDYKFLCIITTLASEWRLTALGHTAS